MRIVILRVIILILNDIILCKGQDTSEFQFSGTMSFRIAVLSPHHVLVMEESSVIKSDGPEHCCS